jgi:hypothetical protein
MEGVTVVADVANAHFGGEDVPEVIEHPDTSEEIARISWHSTDAWRGYYEAEPLDGWAKVGDGCNCGDWDDAPPGTSNDECEAQLRELAEKHGEVVVVVCGGSNLFAMQYDVLARSDDVEDALYRIVRMRLHGDNETVQTGLTLEEAQTHCQREDTHGDGWFDGYEEQLADFPTAA